MNVRKHMSAPPITISEDTDFKSALGLLQKHRIRRLPVLNAEGVLTGIVAERDLLVAADRYLTSPVDVARIMTRHVVTVGDTTPVVDAAILMIERKIGGLPVVNSSHKLLGIITETDMLKALVAILQLDKQSAQVTRQQPERARPEKTAARDRSPGKRPMSAKPKAPGAKPKHGRKQLRPALKSGRRTGSP